ncbi:MAG TPA: hypothetical protein VE983_05750, partial [Solirubrobacteraceae bacterium]|nr:hypothetical protein [Solirubrobacteraceae bacterium]
MRGVYLTLAILMGGGLILFGVGTGVSGGGLLNAFNGGGSSQSQVVNSVERSAEKAVKAHPNSPGAWANLLQARWTAATTAGSGFDSATGVFTVKGKSELTGLTEAWQRYMALTKSPSAEDGTLAAEAYGALGQYGPAANTWETVSLGAPSSPRAYECLAVAAYAANQTRKGDLATTKVLTLIPKTQQATTKLSLLQAKKSTT